MAKKVTRKYRDVGRTNRPPAPTELEGFIKILSNIDDDAFRQYPEVIDGATGTFRDIKNDEYRVDNISELVQSLTDKSVVSITTIGTVRGSRSNFYFTYSPTTGDSYVELSIDEPTPEKLLLMEDITKIYRKLFPYEQLNDVDVFLMQRGFVAKDTPRREQMPSHKAYSSPSARQELRKSVGASKYGEVFEGYCASICEQEIRWKTKMNVKLLEEGSGGDYDILALNGASNDLVYIEAKTGININTNDIKLIVERHMFLRPALTIIAIDFSKSYLEAHIDSFISAANADHSPGTAPASDYLSGTKSMVVTTHRNIFICSNEDFAQAFRHCIRYYDGVIRQTSYLS